VFCAIRRYAQDERRGAPAPIAIADVRARLRALPIDVFTDRLPELLARSANYYGGA
jgi:hypothetical protein